MPGRHPSVHPAIHRTAELHAAFVTGNVSSVIIPVRRRVRARRRWSRRACCPPGCHTNHISISLHIHPPENRVSTHLKLRHIQTPILILIHHPKNLPHPLLRRILIFRQFHHTPHHLVNRLDNRQHLVVGNLPVAVDVVELEGPVELVLHLAARGDGEGADELLEVDAAGLVGVEDVEDVVGEGGGVAEGEELLVDFLELGFGEHARGAVFEEACDDTHPRQRCSACCMCTWDVWLTLIPLLQLLLVEMRGLLQIDEFLLAQLALAKHRSRNRQRVSFWGDGEAGHARHAPHLAVQLMARDLQGSALLVLVLGVVRGGSGWYEHGAWAGMVDWAVDGGSAGVVGVGRGGRQGEARRGAVGGMFGVGEDVVDLVDRRRGVHVGVCIAMFGDAFVWVVEDVRACLFEGGRRPVACASRGSPCWLSAGAVQSIQPLAL